MLYLFYTQKNDEGLAGFACRTWANLVYNLVLGFYFIISLKTVNIATTFNHLVCQKSCMLLLSKPSADISFPLHFLADSRKGKMRHTLDPFNVLFSCVQSF